MEEKFAKTDERIFGLASYEFHVPRPVITKIVPETLQSHTNPLIPSPNALDYLLMMGL